MASEVSSVSYRIRIVASLAAALLIISAEPVGARNVRTTDFPALYVTFHADKSVTMALPDGTPVGTASGAPTVIAPGTYNLFLDDSTFVSDVEWDLAGPGVKLVSDMSHGESPSETWVETFLPNSTYTFRDDLRPPAVWTFVTSATAALPAPAGTTSTGTSSGAATTTKSSTPKATSTDVVGSGIKTDPLRGALAGTVSSAGKLSLTVKGKAVATLKSGRYMFTVTDKAKTSGFIVQGLRKLPVTVTTAAFTGKKTQTIDLKPGQWLFYASPTAKKNYFIVVG